VDIADFGPGEPDLPTPDHIKQAAIKAINENRRSTLATPGVMPLREAICTWHKARAGSKLRTKRVRHQRCGKHAIFNVISVL